MSYEVARDRVDYTWVLTQQIERIAQTATRYFRTPRARQEQVLAELGGQSRYSWTWPTRS